VLLDASGVLLGVGLAIAGFIVVIVVSATVLRLIGFVLGDGEPNPEGEDAEATASVDAEQTSSTAADAAETGRPGEAGPA
jgi:hypothetical protein